MFIGHYAVGMAAKKWAPKTSLGTLLAAALWLDILWPFFLLLDLEHVRVAPGITRMVPFDFYDYPLSHSLVMALAWSAAFGLVYLVLRNNLKVSGILAGLVFSHWVLDFIVHRPDLPLLPADISMFQHKVGLGLWNSPVGTILVEGLLFAAGVFLYVKSTRGRDKAGKVGFWAFVALLVALYIFNFTSAPPNNPQVIAVIGIAQLLIVAWAYWIDDHRKNV